MPNMLNTAAGSAILYNTEPFAITSAAKNIDFFEDIFTSASLLLTDLRKSSFALSRRSLASSTIFNQYII
ncbi:MAG TPA: hypothetical protein DCP97_03695 [Ruminococcaceae bacterium]|nr:hypothetical protein [Oscillospiraceae bacterium]